VLGFEVARGQVKVPTFPAPRISSKHRKEAHTFQFLTKNPRHLKELNPWPDNCWAGVTAKNQGMFDVVSVP